MAVGATVTEDPGGGVAGLGRDGGNSGLRCTGASAGGPLPVESLVRPIPPFIRMT
jgi:hypothetical protein